MFFAGSAGNECPTTAFVAHFLVQLIVACPLATFLSEIFPSVRVGLNYKKRFDKLPPKTD